MELQAVLLGELGKASKAEQHRLALSLCHKLAALGGASDYVVRCKIVALLHESKVRNEEARGPYLHLRLASLQTPAS